MTDDVTRILRDAYDRKVDERDMRPQPAWATMERDRFLELLQREHNTTLLELGRRPVPCALSVGAALNAGVVASAEQTTPGAPVE
jgi:hypothetical protein